MYIYTYIYIHINIYNVSCSPDWHPIPYAGPGLEHLILCAPTGELINVCKGRGTLPGNSDIILLPQLLQLVQQVHFETPFL